VFAHGDPPFVIPVTKKYNSIFWFKLKAIALTPIVLRINKVPSPTTFKEYATTKFGGCEDISASWVDGSSQIFTDYRFYVS